PQSGHDRLSAGIAEDCAVETGHFAHQLGSLLSQGRLRSERYASGKLLIYGFCNEVWRVAEKMNSETHGDIQVFVAVHVPYFGTGRIPPVYLVDDLFPHRPECRGVRPIRQVPPEALRKLF